jgi:hypothetical protein
MHPFGRVYSNAGENHEEKISDGLTSREKNSQEAPCCVSDTVGVRSIQRSVKALLLLSIRKIHRRLPISQ